MTLEVGELFAGYTVVRQLGAGGFGEVYLVKHPRLPRMDALKVLRSGISNDIDFRRRFLREADSVAKLSHPNIVTVFDRGETDGKLWIASQYVAGADADHLQRSRYPVGMPAEEAATITASVGDALDYAHRNGLLHRDVKPSNILVSDDENGSRRIFLTDFGIVLPLGESSGMTATNAVFGTFAYAAPEQLDGNDLDGRADQYALAATAFHLLAGEPPFTGANPMAILRKRLTQDPPRLAGIRPDLAALEPALSRAMALDPAERYPNCAEFTRDLFRYAAESSAHTSGATLPRYARSSSVHPDGTILVQHAADDPAARFQPSVTETRLAPNFDAARRIASSYATTGRALELGSVVVGRQVDPSAQIRIPLGMLNRHGLVAGASGTGKTRTLQLIAEQLSAAGVPVVMADFKGDLSGLSRPGEATPAITERAEDTADQWAGTPFPVEFLSLGTAGPGVPVRATISAFGPILLSKMLGLDVRREADLNRIFHYADEQGLPLLDLKDLQQVITFLTTTDEGKTQLDALVGVSNQSAAAIKHALANLQAESGDAIFGEPELELADLIRVDNQGRGLISLFELGYLSVRPALLSTFMMWVLADLINYLPEAGNVDKPLAVFVFDEAHLLFKNASSSFLEVVEQMVQLLRSKGLGVFFCTERPTDIPDSVLRQLGARIQHALRAVTPDDQQVLNRSVRSYSKTEFYDLAKDLTALGIGEAIVTVLSERGAPTPVAWTRLRSPRSLMESIGPDYVKAAAEASPMFLKYGQTVDRESAYEMLGARMELSAAAGSAEDELRDLPPLATPEETAEPGMLEQMMENPAFKNAMRSAGTVVGREITRSIFGTGRRRR